MAPLFCVLSKTEMHGNPIWCIYRYSLVLCDTAWQVYICWQDAWQSCFPTKRSKMLRFTYYCYSLSQLPVRICTVCLTDDPSRWCCPCWRNEGLLPWECDICKFPNHLCKNMCFVFVERHIDLYVRMDKLRRKLSWAAWDVPIICLISGCATRPPY